MSYFTFETWGFKNTQVEFSLLSLYYKVYVLSGWFAGCLFLTLTNWWNLFSVFERSFPVLQLKILKFIVISVMSSYTFTWILEKFPRFGEGLYIFETHIAPLNDLTIWIRLIIVSKREFSYISVYKIIFA